MLCLTTLSIASDNISKKIFIRVEANKEKIYEQEPFILSYKVYTLLDLSDLEGNMPELNGFHVQEVEQPLVKEFHDEIINGIKYRCVTWSQYVMYPQVTGNVTIPSFVFNGTVIKENKSTDPIEDFFEDRQRFEKVNISIAAPQKTIHVTPLPTPPNNFSKGVGTFRITSSLDKGTVKAGNPITLRIVISGAGNLKLIKAPIINLPKDFEKYDIKVTDSTRFTDKGYVGSMIFDYPIVPINQGTYIISPISFIYFNLEKESYETINTKPISINVGKGSGNLSLLNDIHPIKKGESLQFKNVPFVGDLGYVIIVIIILIVYIILLIALYKHKIKNSDVVSKRFNKANSIAIERLKKAKSLMDNGKNEKFYDEVLHALWGYVADKMNIPAEELSNDNIKSRLSDFNVDEETSKEFITAIDECEYERYAPGDVAGNMKRTYESAMSAIMEIEKKAKDKKKGNTVSLVLLIFTMMVLSAIPTYAVTKEQADAEYSDGNYQQAIKDYNALLKEGVSSELYYNLGNAYYRTKDLGKAILSYERARILAPNDSDINYNLQYAYSKTVDKITPAREAFYVTWYKAIANSNSIGKWMIISIIILIIAMLLFPLYLFSRYEKFRRIGLYSSILLLITFLLTTIFAYQQKRDLEDRSKGIITVSSTEIKKSPNANSDNVVTVHEGAPVELTNESFQQWIEVKLPDEKQGWILRTAFEII